jgi:hypothetical protein
MSFFRGCVLLGTHFHHFFTNTQYSTEDKDLMRSVREMSLETKREGSEQIEVGPVSNAIENTVKTLRWGYNYAYSYLYPNKSTEAPPAKNEVFETEGKSYEEVTVLRKNWYGRTQKRIYRFYDEFFQRIDPNGAVDGSELVKATYKYSDVAKITIENSTDLVI